MPVYMKYSVRNLAIKSLVSSFIGLPISFGVNILILNWIVNLSTQMQYAMVSLVIAIPFALTSALRLFVIDYVYDRFNIRLDPVYHIGKLRKMW